MSTRRALQPSQPTYPRRVRVSVRLSASSLPPTAPLQGQAHSRSSAPGRLITYPLKTQLLGPVPFSHQVLADLYAPHPRGLHLLTPLAARLVLIPIFFSLQPYPTGETASNSRSVRSLDCPQSPRSHGGHERPSWDWESGSQRSLAYLGLRGHLWSG